MQPEESVNNRKMRAFTTCVKALNNLNWIRKTGTNLLSLSQCSDGQEYLISLKFRPIAENKVVVKRLVYALTDELRTDYQQCMEQAAAWSKYVIPAYSF